MKKIGTLRRIDDTKSVSLPIRKKRYTKDKIIKSQPPTTSCFQKRKISIRINVPGIIEYKKFEKLKGFENTSITKEYKKIANKIPIILGDQ